MSALRGRTIAATPWRVRLEEAIAFVRSDPGAEPVHRLRVASERLKVWLTLSGDFALREELSWLRARAGRVRDLDVRLAMGPPRRVAARWRRERAAARRTLLAALRSARVASLLAALAHRPAVTAHQAARATRALAVRALNAHLDGHRLPALHRQRRALRRLRFALEWQRRPAADLTALQDALGQVCDCALARRSARGHHLRALRRRLGRDQEEASERARARWRAARPRLERLAR